MEPQVTTIYYSTYFLAQVLKDTFIKYSFCGSSESTEHEGVLSVVFNLEMEPWSFMDYVSKSFDQRIEKENLINSLDEDEKEPIILTINDLDEECVDFTNFGNFLDKYFETGVRKFMIQNNKDLK